jgi:hypothetical protein
MLGLLPTSPYEPDKHTHNYKPLRPDEIVTDHTLRMFIHPKTEYQSGEIQPKDQAILCNIMPDVFSELLSYRLAARKADEL